MENKRYYADIRNSAGAVVDTFYPWNEECLDSYLPSCHMYLLLSQTDEKARAEAIAALKKEADKLNSENTVQAGEVKQLLADFNNIKERIKKMFPKVYQIRVD